MKNKHSRKNITTMSITMETIKHTDIGVIQLQHVNIGDSKTFDVELRLTTNIMAVPT